MKKDEQPCVYNFPVVSKQVFGQHVSRVEDVHIGEGGDQDSLEGGGGGMKTSDEQMAVFMNT